MSWGSHRLWMTGKRRSTGAFAPTRGMDVYNYAEEWRQAGRHTADHREAGPWTTAL